MLDCNRAKFRKKILFLNEQNSLLIDIPDPAKQRAAEDAASHPHPVRLRP